MIRKLTFNFRMTVDLAIIICICVILIYIYIGFFYIDPIAGKLLHLIVLSIRILFPIIALLAILLYISVRRKKIALSSIVLVGLSICLCGFISYPIISFYLSEYKFQNRANLRLYHPYLQLSPNDYKNRSDVVSVSHPIKIFCLGGSTTEWKINKMGWPERLEKNMVEHGYKQVQVYNLGREWYTSQHTLFNYVVNLRKNKPDVVIIMHAINDLWNNCDFSFLSNGPFHEDYRHFYGPVIKLIKRPTPLSEAIKIIPRIWYHRPRMEITTDYFPGLHQFSQNIKTIIELCRLDNTKVILMTQPYLAKENMPDREKNALKMLNTETISESKKWTISTELSGMRQYNNAVKKLSIEENVYLIDLEAAVPKNLDYFIDDVHYTEKAFDLIAEKVKSELLRMKVLE